MKINKIKILVLVLLTLFSFIGLAEVTIESTKYSMSSMGHGAGCSINGEFIWTQTVSVVLKNDLKKRKKVKLIIDSPFNTSMYTTVGARKTETTDIELSLGCLFYAPKIKKVEVEISK